MAGQFLTKAEREELSSFPPYPTEEDIITFFALDFQEIALVNQRTGDLNFLSQNFEEVTSTERR